MRRSIALAAACVLTAIAPVSAAQSPSPTPKPGGAPGITSAAAILVDLSDGGQIRFQRAATAQRAPASLTKVVTALVARDEYDLDEVVTASPLVLQTHGSDLGLETGTRSTVRDLLYALLLKSANDAGMALAAHHPAGYEFFIQLMNEKARSLGAYDTQLRNPHGLDQIGHYSSARDMAMFAAEMVRDPVLVAIAGKREHTMVLKGRRRVFSHHHKMLLANSSVIAGKTGFTNQAGHSLLTASRVPAGTFVTIVLGSQDQYADTTSLLDYGRSLALRQGSGGGAVEGFGTLPLPPSPPDEALPPAISDMNDPRDDLRWPVLMMVLAALTAATLLFTRRRAAGDASVHAWLAALAEDERRRRGGMSQGHTKRGGPGAQRPGGMSQAHTKRWGSGGRSAPGP